MTDISWIHEVDYESNFDEEYLGLIEEIGLENTVKVILYWAKMKVDITEKSLRKMKVAYIRKHKAHLRNNGRGQKRAARLLGVSDRFIQKVLADDNVDNYDFFEEEND